VEAWPSPVVPTLPGRGLPLRLYDTATQQVVPTSPGPTARMYVCGITPYDATHLGHAATYVAFDLVNRAWRDAGHDVHYVQNVTDIDDPLLERAVATGQDWTELARRETALFREDMTALRVLAPDHYIGAVEAIPGIVELIQQLQAKGAAYDVDGDVYFDLSTDPRFGGVANLSREQMLTVFGERGGDPDRPGKRDPLDCLLWLQQRPDEPAWETELGHGRPGWHIECTAIALNHLGMSFDVQGGGSDLAFPHHEMGASEAHVLTGEWPYARAYVHAGMVGLDGEKMSKSRGNLVFVSVLRTDGVDPMAIRLALLAHHYRQDWEWTDADLAGASKRLDAWRAAVSATATPPAAPVIQQLRAAMSDDLDAPRALRFIDAWADEVGRGRGDDADAGAQVADAVDSLLGVRLARDSAA
jgi:L-cysteine:1D-myo-inositol 2-amino-2-deoxy-alpha-D-glucopyranoside ligase